ncbi:restriction endonuclease subunit S [Castellaniella sp.]|uniref:restriction endonuclease subunit S n=1 Tax=Castellaniella sp. TaxID=1955812 RepID=UPI003C792650
MSIFNGPIKEVCLGIYDGPHATPKEAETGPIFLGIKNVTADGRLDFSEIRHVSEQEFQKWTRRVTPKTDDIVFSYEATLHLYGLIPEGFHGCLGRRMALVRPDPLRVVPRYLHYYFLSPMWKSVITSNVITGATVDRIPLARFPDFPVRIPSLMKQQRIADTLSSYDDLIENNRRRIALLEQAARLLYREWFVHLRFPGHEHVKVVDGVPEGCIRKPLGEIATLNYGKALKAENRTPGTVPVYGSSGIVGTNATALSPGPGVIVGRKGNVGSVYWSSTSFFPIDTVYYIDAKLSNLYLYYALQHAQFINTDVAVPGLNRDFAHGRELLIPDESLLTSFLESVTPMHQQIDKLTQYNTKLREVRDLLLPRLMSGEIEV